MSEERIIRINKVLRELNISLERAVDYLKDKGIAIEANPNTKISDDVYNVLCGQFSGDRGKKEASKEVGEEKKKEKGKVAKDEKGAFYQKGEGDAEYVSYAEEGLMLESMQTVSVPHTFSALTHDWLVELVGADYARGLREGKSKSAKD